MQCSAHRPTGGLSQAKAAPAARPAALIQKGCRIAGSPDNRRTTHICHGKGFGELMKLSGKKKPAKKKGGAGKADEAAPKWQRDRRLCPCLSGMTYEVYRETLQTLRERMQECCRRYHDRKEEAPTPEVVMRARFSAYVKDRVKFLVRTTHSDNPSFNGSWYDGKQVSTLAEDYRATVNKISWQHFELLEVEDGEKDSEGYVKFRTWFKYKGQKGERQAGTKMHCSTERSKFVQEDGCWYYLDGETDYTFHDYSTAGPRSKQGADVAA